jgi:ATP-dependent helicase/nuclease subunit A
MPACAGKITWAMSSRSPKVDPVSQPSLFDGNPEPAAVVAVPEREPAAPDSPDSDEAARRFAVDPRNNVVLEASAGTGKTSVLVARYVNLLKAGVEPANILAITFTRKAAADMRERIVTELREAASRSDVDRVRWTELRDRLGEIAISTIDAFCLSLLREFPLEADVDPGFEMADETEVPRLMEESLDQSLRIFTGLARKEPDVALVLAQLGLSRTREGLAALLERRLVAWSALDRFLARGPANLTSSVVCRRTLAALQDTLRSVPGGLPQFLEDGPLGHPRYLLLVRELRRLSALEQPSDSEIRALLDRVAAHFLTGDGRPRTSGALHPYKAEHYSSSEASRRHRAAVGQMGTQVERIVSAFARDLNAIMARGIKRMFAIALSQYRRALDERSVLDFSDVLQRAVDLLRQMDEFAQSRYRLESRYHHVLVDEFQDTSRAQWELVSLLVESWGEGLGLATQPSVFIVGDRKQSIYRFRGAEVAVLEEAGRYIEALRPGGSPRRSIARSFRAVPALLEFVNDAFTEVSQGGERADEFTYRSTDCFPINPSSDTFRGPVLGIAVADEPVASAAAVAAEVARVLREDSVRDRKMGTPRPTSPGDIAILFRSRASHREFEHELELLGIPTYVYKGLGFFDADETKDVVALVRYLARPVSDLRAAAFLRSRFVRLSDHGLGLLAPHLAAALTDAAPPDAVALLEEEDRRVLLHAREQVCGWVQRVDRVPPADLLEELIQETAYAYELRGPRRLQAWENLKKIRAMIRRIQNRGYATLPRIAEHIDALTAGDESNAVIEALDAVNLMTVHASKGLEFPIVFVVNMAKGASGPPKPIRVVANGDEEPSVSIGPFVSDSDEADREREKHETRRLLYVAFTRARDRLYLASALKSGVLVPGRGSLGEVLPDSLKALFGRAATAFPEYRTVAWSGASGRTFEFRLCRQPSDMVVPTPSVPIDGPPRRDLLGTAAVAGQPVRTSVSRWLEDERPSVTAVSRPATDVVVGRLVHRLFQFAGAAPDDDAGLRARATALIAGGERALLEDPTAVADAAVNAWRAIRTRPDIVSLLGDGRPRYEVPFSFYDPESAQILRGTIDCVVQRPDGWVTVVEFKTGAPRPVHQRQLSLYVRAAECLFPSTKVNGLLVYP